MTHVRRYRLLAAVTVALIAAFAAAPASAHTPTAGASDTYAQDITLYWRFENCAPSPCSAALWPSYAMDAVRDALDSGSPTSGWANVPLWPSGIPDFVESSSGAGQLFWTATATSPCSGEMNGWIGCNPGHAFGATNWDIHVRDLTNAPLGSSVHWDEHPSSHSTRFMMKRVVIHEALHNVLTRYHDSQSTSYTVMQDTTPAATAAGWTSLNYLVCDGAAAQLEYDVKYLSSPYADCFDHIANHGTNGLKTKLNVAGLPLAQCTGDPVVFSGTLSVGNDTTNYKQLSGNPLGLRTVWLERAPVGSSSFTTIASTTTHSSGGTYSFSVTYYSAQSWAFRVRFNEQAGLDGRYSTETLTASWASQCPL